ncbi:MAG: hypothetical protein J0L97_03105 [Alphaproteobacteria bacterium]|nr:hypothetical protein [Alphaproteobacteria bacterium]
MKKILAISVLALLTAACTHEGTSTCMRPNNPWKDCHHLISKDHKMQCEHALKDGAGRHGDIRHLNYWDGKYAPVAKGSVAPATKQAAPAKKKKKRSKKHQH